MFKICVPIIPLVPTVPTGSASLLECRSEGSDPQCRANVRDSLRALFVASSFELAGSPRHSEPADTHKMKVSPTMFMKTKEESW